MTKADGSALLIVLCIMTALMTYSITNWYSTMFLVESVRKRLQNEQQRELLKALLDFGVFCGKAQYDALLRRKSSTLECGSWPSGASDCEGKIAFKALKNSLKIHATLHKHGDVGIDRARHSSCLLVPQGEPNKIKTFFVKDVQWS